MICSFRWSSFPHQFSLKFGKEQHLEKFQFLCGCPYKTDEHSILIMWESDKWSFVHYSLLIVGGVAFNLVQKTSCQYQVWTDNLVMLDILYNWSLVASAFFCLLSVNQRYIKKKRQRCRNIKIHQDT